MTTNIKDKVVLVTGGANGLGFQYATDLLRHHAKRVAILDLPTSNGEAAVKKLESEFGKDRAFFLPCDVTNAEQLETSFKKVHDTCNGIDIVINNAGILDDKRWELTIDINITAVIRATLLALNLMGKHNGGKGGTIVNISSILGLMPAGITPVYCASKHAIIGFTRSLQYNYNKTGVRMLIMCPGLTTTTLIPNSSDRFLDFIGELGPKKVQEIERQTIDYVGRAMIELIETGKNGTVCVSEESKPPYAVNLPFYAKLKAPL